MIQLPAIEGGDPGDIFVNWGRPYAGHTFEELESLPRQEVLDRLEWKSVGVLCDELPPKELVEELLARAKKVSETLRLGLLSMRCEKFKGGHEPLAHRQMSRREKIARGMGFADLEEDTLPEPPRLMSLSVPTDVEADETTVYYQVDRPEKPLPTKRLAKHSALLKSRQNR